MPGKVLTAICLLSLVTAAHAGDIIIPYVSELAYDQPRVGVYFKDMSGAYLPVGTEGYVVPGLLDTGAAAHVIPKYLAEAVEMPMDDAGEAEVLTLCGYSEYMDVSQNLFVGVGPVESENELDYVEVGPHRLVVRRVDPAGADLLGFPMIVGAPFLHDYSAWIDWQFVEVWPGIELPQLLTALRPAGTPGEPVDLELSLTMWGETNSDPDLSLPTAAHIPFIDVVLRNAGNRLRRSLLVDTGAQISFMSTPVAEALGVDLANPVDSLPVQGAGTCSLTINGYLLDEMIFPARNNLALAYQQPIVYIIDVPGIDGGIGSNMLFFFDELLAVDIDLHGQRVGIKLTVPIPPGGDLNGDGVVDAIDLLILARAWNTTADEPAYDERADVNHDGLINVVELLQLARDWGATGL